MPLAHESHLNEWVEPFPGANYLRQTLAVAEADVLAALHDRLAKFKQPKRVFFVDELPRNAMGKVQKNVLREIYARTYARGAA